VAILVKIPWLLIFSSPSSFVQPFPIPFHPRSLTVDFA